MKKEFVSYHFFALYDSDCNIYRLGNDARQLVFPTVAVSSNLGKLLFTLKLILFGNALTNWLACPIHWENPFLLLCVYSVGSFCVAVFIVMNFWEAFMPFTFSLVVYCHFCCNCFIICRVIICPLMIFDRNELWSAIERIKIIMKS